MTSKEDEALQEVALYTISSVEASANDAASQSCFVVRDWENRRWGYSRNRCQCYASVHRIIDGDGLGANRYETAVSNTCSVRRLNHILRVQKASARILRASQSKHFLHPITIFKQLTVDDRHAGRTTISTDDVMLLSRRNEGLQEVLEHYLETLHPKKPNATTRRWF